tara:strand:+ start:2996 stop:3133 length:138 start_codon:yes stop_codon:yes gene_type:complete
MSNLEKSLKKANSAFAEGDYQTAYEIWNPLAKEGNTEAQNNLGKV